MNADKTEAKILEELKRMRAAEANQQEEKKPKTASKPDEQQPKATPQQKPESPKEPVPAAEAASLTPTEQQEEDPAAQPTGDPLAPAQETVMLEDDQPTASADPGTNWADKLGSFSNQLQDPLHPAEAVD
jgi:hypothetical protein